MHRLPPCSHTFRVVRASRVAIALALAFASSLALGACGPSHPEAKGPSRPQSQWVGEEAELFDDGIDVGAVPGSAASSGAEDIEAKAATRTLKGDGVVLAKIIGVASEPVGDKQRFRLELLTDTAPLAGAKIDSPFTLVVPPDSPSYGTVRSQEAQLIGKKFVVFFRRYAGEEGGDPVTHFHISGNDKRVLDAVERAKTKKQVESGWLRPGRESGLFHGSI